MNSRLFHKTGKLKALVYVFVLYIFAQFLWWEILMARLHAQLMEEKQKVLELTVSDEALLKQQIELIQQQRQKKILMIAGEGTIFLLILLYGVALIRKSQKQEAMLMEQKNNFLLSITHELKTPLTTTKLQLQTLKKHQLPPDKRLAIIDLAIQENERLNVLIDNVLLATRMQQSTFYVSLEKTDITAFIQELIVRTYKQEMERGLIKTNFEPALYLPIDKIAFPSIVLNLTDNAIKYSPEQPEVQLQLKKEGTRIVFTISDTGVGINDKEKGEIFNQFYRSGSEEVRKTKGTGLGLFIVKYLVEKHGGTIQIEDNHPKGSVFKLVFPMNA
jgi:signal transduction histidine kinase